MMKKKTKVRPHRRKNKSGRTNVKGHSRIITGKDRVKMGGSGLTRRNPNDYVTKFEYVNSVLEDVDYPPEAEEHELALTEIAIEIDEMDKYEKNMLIDSAKHKLGWALGEQFEDIINDPMKAIDNPRREFEEVLRESGKGEFADSIKFLREES